MFWFSSFLALAATTAPAVAVYHEALNEMTDAESISEARSRLKSFNKYLGQVDVELREQFLGGKVAECLLATQEYKTARTTDDCASVTCTPTSGNTACCQDATPRPDDEDGCEAYHNDEKECCYDCLDSSGPLFSINCVDEERIGASVCLDDDNTAGTSPLPANYECSTSPAHDLDGMIEGDDDQDPKTIGYTCDDMMASFKSGEEGSDWVSETDGTLNPTVETMAEYMGILWHPVLAGGEFDILNTTRCAVIVQPVSNGKFTIQGGAETDAKIYRPFVYDTASPSVYSDAEITVVGGTNYGTLEFNTEKSIHLWGINNYGDCKFIDSGDVIVLDVQNTGDILFEGVTAKLNAVSNDGTVTVKGDYFDATAIYNNGTINIESGSGIFELYSNTGTVTISEGVTGTLYAPSSDGITLPSTGVTLHLTTSYTTVSHLYAEVTIGLTGITVNHMDAGAQAAFVGMLAAYGPENSTYDIIHMYDIPAPPIASGLPTVKIIFTVSTTRDGSSGAKDYVDGIILTMKDAFANPASAPAFVGSSINFGSTTMDSTTVVLFNEPIIDEPSLQVEMMSTPGNGNSYSSFIPQTVLFGNVTSITARRNKNAWMGDNSGICDDAIVKRFNVLAFTSVIQSPYNDVLNMVIHLQHRKQTIARDRAFLRLSIFSNTDVEVFSEEQNLFDETSLLTHFTPAVNMTDDTVYDDLKIGLQVNFTEEQITPFHMDYHAKLEVRITDVAGNDDKVYDCVRLDRTGVVGYDDYY